MKTLLVILLCWPLLTWAQEPDRTIQGQLNSLKAGKLNAADTINQFAPKSAGLSVADRLKFNGIQVNAINQTTANGLYRPLGVLLDYATEINNKPVVYTQAQVNTLLQGYYLPTLVATKAAAIALATGVQPRIIKVQVDESDGNAIGNKYIYDGDGVALGYPLF